MEKTSTQHGLHQARRSWALRLRPCADAVRAHVEAGDRMLPYEILLGRDGSAVVSYRRGEQLVRFDSLDACLHAHHLRAQDVEPLDTRPSRRGRPRAQHG